MKLINEWNKLEQIDAYINGEKMKNKQQKIIEKKIDD